MKRIRSLLLLSASTTIVYLMGYVMGHGHYKQAIGTAIANNDNPALIKTLYEFQQSGADLNSSLLYFSSMTKVHLDNGNLAGAKYNNRQVIDILIRK